jgi:hypothetical protein
MGSYWEVNEAFPPLSTLAPRRARVSTHQALSGAPLGAPHVRGVRTLRSHVFASPRQSFDANAYRRSPSDPLYGTVFDEF